MRILTRLSLLILGAALVGCANPAGPSTPVETRKWDIVDNNYQFYTNDTANYGFFFFHPLINSSVPVFTEMTGVVKKVSGAKNYGYGFVFCYADGENFYEVSITTTGYLRVYEFFEGTWYAKTAWIGSDAIVQGFGKENTIRVTRSPQAFFTVSVNGIPVGTFTDDSFQNNSFGPSVSIGDAEDEGFPGTPVDVRFRITSPTTKPSGSMSSYQEGRAETRRSPFLP